MMPGDLFHGSVYGALIRDIELDPGRGLETLLV
jgi:hypothetical protein